MYTPRGSGVSELGDIEVVPLGDELHLFHLTLPNHDVVQHAVSRDGLSWTPLPAALRTGDPGAIDDDQIWTVSVTPRPNGDGYLMLYTALTTADAGRVQRVAAATSDDVLHWVKCSDNPVSQADPRWYEAEPGPAAAVSWRDPKVTRVEDRFLAMVCAREGAGPIPRRGCVGLMVSKDLHHWEVQPPLFSPRRYWDLECPQLFRLQGGPESETWYLTAAVMEDRSQRYWYANAPTGPFRVPPHGDILAPPGHYAARVTNWQGLDLLFAWHQPKLADGWMTSPETVDWVEARNPFGKFLAHPLVLTKRSNRSLAHRSFPWWEAYLAGDWQPPIFGTQALFSLAQIEPTNRWRIACRSAMDLLSSHEPVGDFVVEGVLTLEGPRGGLAIRLDESGSGLYVDLESDSQPVSLQRWGAARNPHDQCYRHSFDDLQSVVQFGRLSNGAPMPFRLLSVGPYIEFALAGEVALATMTGVPMHGRWGIWVQDGSLHATDVRWAPMQNPADPNNADFRNDQETNVD